MGFRGRILGRPRHERPYVLIPVGYPAPGARVPDIKKNLEDFRSLPLTEEIKQAILSKTALSIWPV